MRSDLEDYKIYADFVSYNRGNKNAIKLKN